MKNTKFRLSVTLLLLLILANARAQQTIAASGGNATGSGGSVSYTVGQLFYTTSSGTNGSVAQGVQQPYEISVLTGMTESSISLQCSVYPNPVSDFLTLSIESKKDTKYLAKLFDLNGKLLNTYEVSGNETFIDMSGLAIAPYVLSVFQSAASASKDQLTKQGLKSFKIIKH